MDKKLSIKSFVSSEESPGCDSESDEHSPRSEKRSRRKEKKSLHKSGKSKTLTSYVRYPQEWPHSHLSLSFVSRPKQYEELTIAEFSAGFATILEAETNEEIRSYRTKHFKNLMYLATNYHWKNVLNFHAACLLEIERGNLTWRSDFRDLQTTTLAGGFIPNYQNSSKGGNSSSSGGNQNSILFCKGYQRGTCQQTKDHYGIFMGNSRYLKHICAKCWLKSKVQAVHPEGSEDCPLEQ